MDIDSLIPAAWFYMEENEKNKLNWFLYEYAGKLFEHIKDSRKEAVREWMRGLGDDGLAWFCAYFAKRMRVSVYRHLYRDLGGDIVDEAYLRDYCHANTRSGNAAILEACEAAWLELLETCAACPTRCLDEKLSRCEFFDRMERGGYYSY